MRGTILDFNPGTGDGVLSADNGQRFSFTHQDLPSHQPPPRPGTKVDFEADSDSGLATAIYPLPERRAAPTGTKNRQLAGLLALLLGGLGIHKFYLGQTAAGVIMLLGTLLGFGLLWIPTVIFAVIGLIEGVIYLINTDEDFYQTYEVRGKAWF